MTTTNIKTVPVRIIKDNNSNSNFNNTNNKNMFNTNNKIENTLKENLSEIFSSLKEKKNNTFTKARIINWTEKRTYNTKIGNVLDKISEKVNFSKVKLPKIKISNFKFLLNKKFLIVLSLLIISPIVMNTINNVIVKINDSFYVYEIKNTYEKINKNEKTLQKKVIWLDTEIAELQAKIDLLTAEKNQEISYYEWINWELYKSIENIKWKLNTKFENWDAQ